MQFIYKFAARGMAKMSRNLSPYVWRRLDNERDLSLGNALPVGSVLGDGY